MNSTNDISSSIIIYGQVVVGPPGSGKTTYCVGMQEYLRLSKRQAWVINLDPANERIDRNNDGNNHSHYDTLLDVCDDVIHLQSVMEELHLGPNGGLMYCMEYLEAHVDDLATKIKQRIVEKEEEEQEEKDSIYLLFDLPGQVELYTHGNAISRLFHTLSKMLNLRLVAVQLLDAHYCTQPSTFLSAALLATSTMLKLELPTVNILSKVDLLSKNYGNGDGDANDLTSVLPLSLEFFTECTELERLVPFVQQQQVSNEETAILEDMDDYYADDSQYQQARRQRRQKSPFFHKHTRLHHVIAELVDDFGLLSLLPMDIQSAESVGKVLQHIDKAHGYVYTNSS